MSDTAALATAFLLGRSYERARVAAGHAELDAAWRPVGRLGYEARVAARIAEFELCAERVAASMGRVYVEYTGGPVRWEPAR